LTKGIEYLEGLNGYDRALILLRCNGRPIGTVTVPCHNGILRPGEVISAMGADRSVKRNLIWERLDDWLMRAGPPASRYPGYTIIVYAEGHDRLGLCISSLCNVEGQGEIVVLGDELIRDAIPGKAGDHPVRFLACGGDAHALSAINSEVFVFLDGRALVDKRWLPALLEPFNGSRVAAAFGPEVPFELENDAQEAFDRVSSYRQGFRRRELDYYTMAPSAVGLVDCCSNVAIRRDHIDLMRLFASAGGQRSALRYGIKRALYAAVSGGYRALYAPFAIARHIHPDDRSDVCRRLAERNDECMAYLLDCFLDRGDWQSLSVGASYLAGLLRQPLPPAGSGAFNLCTILRLYAEGREREGTAARKPGIATGRVRDRA